MAASALTPPDSDASSSEASGGLRDVPQVLTRGTSLGRYIVLEAVGTGGQGVVYSAFDPQLDRKVALKLVRVKQGGDASETQRARLLKEAQVLARLSHPNVVTVHDVGRFADQVFIAMEFMSGGTLAAWLEQPRSQADVLEKLTQAGRGLAFAHAAGVVHRDFKPDNVLLDGRGVAHVTDFGLARDVDGAVVMGGGTRRWMAPEQRDGRPVGPRADQYAFCLVFVQALTGVVPGGDELGDGPPVVPPSVPPWLRQVLQRGLAVDPDARFPSMDALLSALAEDPTVARRRAATTAVSVLGLVAVGVISGALLLRETPAERAARECTSAVDEVMPRHFAAPRLAQMRASFEGAVGPAGGEVFDKVWRQLEPEQKAWTTVARAMCQLSPDEPRRRLVAPCLETRRAVLESLAEVLLSADARVVENALTTVAVELQPVASCGVAEAQALPVTADSDADRRLRPALSRARVLRAAGRYADGMSLALQIAGEAEEAGARRVEAEAQLLGGALAAELRRADAEALLRAAASLSERVGADDERARAFLSLTGWYADRRRLDEAHRAHASAEDILTRLGRPELLEAQRLTSLGQLLDRQGDGEGAAAAFREALARRRRLLPPGHPLVTRALMNYGLSLPPEEGQPILLEVLAVQVQTLGENHPETATAEHNVGLVMLGTGACQGARTHLARALAIRQQRPAADPVRLGREYAVLARAQECLGQLDAAADGLQHGIDALREGGATDDELKRELGHLYDLLERLERPQHELDQVTEALRRLE
ncbi:MAG: serine/threonine-protein kinase [Myxococcaceae bacterium]|nr:serine/threonine-protein kinase [Myxococcaceae bacterium]